MKKSHHDKTTKPDSLAAYDEAVDCCLNIQALAELLACQRAVLPPDTVFRVSSLFSAEAEKLRQQLEALLSAARK